MRSFKFSQVKLQVIELIDECPALNKAPLELALRLVVKHLDRTDATEAITDEQLGESLSWKPEKVSRAVKSLAASGLFSVRRGRWLRATEYSLTEATWQEAIARRKQVDKITDMRARTTPEKSNSYSGKFQSNSPEKSGASFRTETREDAFSGKEADWFFVKYGDYALVLWREATEKDGLPPLERLSPETLLDGTKGHWLPGRWPSPRSTTAWEHQRSVLLGGSRSAPVGERGQRHA